MTAGAAGGGAAVELLEALEGGAVGGGAGEVGWAVARAVGAGDGAPVPCVSMWRAWHAQQRGAGQWWCGQWVVWGQWCGQLSAVSGAAGVFSIRTPQKHS